MMGLRNPSEFESDTAQHQAQQHHENRNVQRRHQDGVRQGKRDQQASTTEHEPGLVAVPEWGDGVHHLVAFGLDLRRRKENADAEIEAVKNDVHHHGEAEQGTPDDRERILHRSPRELRRSGVALR